MSHEQKEFLVDSIPKGQNTNSSTHSAPWLSLIHTSLSMCSSSRLKASVSPPGKITPLDSSGILIPSSSSVGSWYLFSLVNGVEQPSNIFLSTTGIGFKGGPIDDTTEQNFLYVKGAFPPLFVMILRILNKS